MFKKNTDKTSKKNFSLSTVCRKKKSLQIQILLRGVTNQNVKKLWKVAYLAFLIDVVESNVVFFLVDHDTCSSVGLKVLFSSYFLLSECSLAKMILIIRVPNISGNISSWFSTSGL